MWTNSALLFLTSSFHNCILFSGFCVKLRKLPCLAINRFFFLWILWIQNNFLQIYFCFTLLSCSPFDYLSFLSLVVLYFSLCLSFLPVPLSESALWLVVLPSLCALVSVEQIQCPSQAHVDPLHCSLCCIGPSLPQFAVVKWRGGPSSLYTHINFTSFFFFNCKWTCDTKRLI